LSQLKASEPLVEDPDILRAAKLMIDQHGEEVALQAAQRADKLLEDGDLEGSIVWCPDRSRHRGTAARPAERREIAVKRRRRSQFARYCAARRRSPINSEFSASLVCAGVAG
jgi:hypothetical protein